MNIVTLKRMCIEEINAVYEKANKHYGTSLKPPEIKFSKRMTSTAGTATSNRYTYEGIRITLSLPLLEKNGQEFVSRTPAHEAAHIIAIALFKGDGFGHGRRWQEVMRVMGKEPSRTHNFKVDRNLQEVYCKCRTHRVGPIQYKRIKTMKRTYSCNTCRARVTTDPNYYLTAA